MSAVPELALRTACLFETQARDETEIFWQFDRPFLIEASAIIRGRGTGVVRPAGISSPVSGPTANWATLPAVLLLT